jgi:hypothetical protein
MITNEEALTLLELALCGDNRTIDKANVMLWREVAKQGGWNLEQGMRAVIEHRTYKPGVYLEPGHVTQRVAEVRKDIRTRWYAPTPPLELADDPSAEIAWRRRVIAEFVERNLSLWAQGEPLEDAPLPTIENEKRGELPTAGPGDSQAKREALAQLRRFTWQTSMPERARTATEHALAIAARVGRWEAVDACELCDEEGVRRGGEGQLITCTHPSLPTPRRVASSESAEAVGGGG